MWKRVICKFVTQYTIQPAGNSNNILIVSLLLFKVNLFFSLFLLSRPPEPDCAKPVDPGTPILPLQPPNAMNALPRKMLAMSSWV